MAWDTGVSLRHFDRIKTCHDLLELNSSLYHVDFRAKNVIGAQRAFLTAKRDTNG